MADALKLNLEELADVLGISLPTARKMVREPGFPVEKVGGNGDPYEFDADDVKAWKADHETRVAAEQAVREQQLRQLRLELVGGTTVDETTLTLSAREQAAYLEAEVAATRLKKMRGELVAVAEVEAGLANLLARFRAELAELGTRVGKRHELPRETIAAIDAEARSVLERLATGMRAQTRHAADAAA